MKFIKGINIQVAPTLVRYSGPFLKWTREEFQQMDQRTRKLMTMRKALHPGDDKNRRYQEKKVSRKEGRRGLASIEDGVDTSLRRLKDLIKKKKRRITATKNNTNNTRISKKKKQLYGHFKRQSSEISPKKTWTWLRKGNL